jgi:preprotein translocase subunit SecE
VADKKEKKPNVIVRYFRETIGELRRVSWPTWKEAWDLTKIVLIVMVAMSMVLGLLDYVFSAVITRLLAI